MQYSNAATQLINSLTRSNASVCIFRADKNPNKWSDYCAGRQTVLQEMGVHNLINSIADLENYYVVIIYSQETLEPMCAARIQIKTAKSPLHIEAVFSKIFPEGNLLIQQAIAAGSFAEFGGLWVNKRFRKEGISRLLVLFTLSLSYALNLSSVIALATHKSLAIGFKYGYELDKQFGAQGFLNYPDTRFPSGVVWFKEDRLEKYFPEKYVLIKALAKIYQDNNFIDTYSFDTDMVLALAETLFVGT